MTPKQQRFVSEYLVDLNATQAAIRAGYSAKNANVIGPRLLVNVGISAAIAAGKGKQLEAAELSAARVLEEMRRLAFVDMRSFFDEHGNLKPIHELAAEHGSVLASFEVIKKNAQAGDGVIDTIHKIKLWDKVRALEGLAKHFGLLIERVQVSGEVSLIQSRLVAARARMAAHREAREGASPADPTVAEA
jgi:phage terminase small subunit